MRRVLIAAALLSSAAAAARAEIVIHNVSPAGVCSEHAALAADGRMSSEDAVKSCSAALVSEPLTPDERLAALVNRGVLRLSMRQWRHAREDFDRAATLRPDLGDIYINRAATLIGEGRYQEALGEADRGIALNPVHPERGYYNRALAREGLSDVGGAYRDYRKALELRPGWDRAEKALAGFTVRRRTP